MFIPCGAIGCYFDIPAGGVRDYGIVVLQRRFMPHEARDDDHPRLEQ